MFGRKSKEEIQIEREMQAEENRQKFEEQVAELESKQEKFIDIAAKAQLNGDEVSYNTAVNAYLHLNGAISALNQASINYDIISVTNEVNMLIGQAFESIAEMSNGKLQLPNIGKIQKTGLKMKKYLRQMDISGKAMNQIMRSSSPSNKTHSKQELSSVQPLIDAAARRMNGGAAIPSAPTGMGQNQHANIPSFGAQANSTDSQLNDVANRKNRII